MHREILLRLALQSRCHSDGTGTNEDVNYVRSNLCLCQVALVEVRILYLPEIPIWMCCCVLLPFDEMNHHDVCCFCDVYYCCAYFASLHHRHDDGVSKISSCDVFRADHPHLCCFYFVCGVSFFLDERMSGDAYDHAGCLHYYRHHHRMNCIYHDSSSFALYDFVCPCLSARHRHEPYRINAVPPQSIYYHHYSPVLPLRVV
mmetsp:Transcript_12669/g.25322  ORF Transcript_12669/g.25322 Transcript_12669/m.25322 type:complete len:202 (+) Transcript_12669:755-1360(+)